jgi:hypothetical protein
VTQDAIVGAARLTAPGGFCPPAYPPIEYPHRWTETVRVQGRLRRAWHRLTGWSTEWTIEYELLEPPPPLRDLLPSFSAKRGGIAYS